MKSFLKRIILVFIIFSLGLILFVFLVHLTIRNASNFEIEKNEKYLVFGHSHSECAYDDTILKGFRNLSSSGEGYFYTYQKVKQVIGANSEVEAIFLEFSNYATGSILDPTIWADETLNVFFPWHSSFMGKEEYALLFKKNSKGLLRTISTSTRDNLSRILSFNFDINKRYGRFLKFERIMTPEEIQNAKNNKEVPFWLELKKEENERTKEAIYHKGKKIPSYNLKYILKIIEFCHERGVQVYLVRSPQHEYYPRGNESAFNKTRESYLSHVEFLDFDRFPLDDNAFGDTEHLNYKGAQIFSSWLNGLIEEGLLEDENKQRLIKTKIEESSSEKTLQNMQ